MNHLELWTHPKNQIFIYGYLGFPFVDAGVQGRVEINFKDRKRYKKGNIKENMV